MAILNYLFGGVVDIPIMGAIWILLKLIDDDVVEDIVLRTLKIETHNNYFILYIMFKYR